MMMKLVEAAITKVQRTGFTVKFTVCDQDSVHRSLFTTLGMTRENPSFMLNDQRIYYFYDPPYLLKNIRNTLMKYDIKVDKTRKASWHHVSQFFLQRIKNKT